MSSINFLFKKQLQKKNLNDEEAQMNEWFVTYTQHNCNAVIVGNVETGKIARKVDLVNVSYIFDCCIWNDGYSEINGNNSASSGISHLIVSCYGITPSIMVLDFNTLNVLFVKTLDNYPHNLIKFLRKSNKEDEKENNEELVCFMGAGDNSKIVLFANKNV